MRTYGTITCDKRYRKFRIKAEPHVVMRMKRVFGKIDDSARGVLTLSATRENARDLEWFSTRYRLDVDDPTYLTQLSREHQEIESTVERLLNGIDPVPQFNLKLPPRDYQKIAAQMWLTVRGLLLGDDVGLGKTISALTGLAQPGTLPALVVTLTHLPEQWKAEIERFTGLEVHILKKATPYDITKYHKGRMPDVVISNYHKLSGWRETFDGVFKAVIFDEASELRHTGSAKYNAARDIAAGAEYRLGLSATPIYNYGAEIWNILEILRPGALGTYEEFVREWCTHSYNGKPKIKDPAALGLYLREAGLMLRRTRKEVGRELPPCTIIPHIIGADTSKIEKMTGGAIELAKLVLRQGEAYKGEKMRAAGEFDLRMRQATGIAKAPFVAEFVKFLHQESGEKIVLFGWHHEVYAIWMELLKDLKPVLYTGQQTPTQKQAAKQAFIEGDSQVLIISNRAGLGLDGLQKVCHIGVVGELDYSPSVHIQNRGRIERDGQGEPILFYFLIAESGSDPIISDILGVKKQQLEGINTPSGDLIEELEVDGDYIKRLAADFLRRNGQTVPEINPQESAT